ncbi:MAG: glycosyl hydrolase family 43 [Ferruginibacter sp.]|nr:glycosyl hydrolase family 43 [Ferruginibacter sp.]
MIQVVSFAQKCKVYDAVYSGISWFDEGGKIVNAHGADIVINNRRFYVFEEAHNDTSNAFAGWRKLVTC